jgi:hypothetical protein
VQVAGSQRWRRLRRDWLRATVCMSSEVAVVAVDPDTATPSSMHGQGCSLPSLFRSRESGDDADASRCRRSVWTLLRDYRMLAHWHDDGEGRPLRCMSLYGGIVAKLL